MILHVLIRVFVHQMIRMDPPVTVLILVTPVNVAINVSVDFRFFKRKLSFDVVPNGFYFGKSNSIGFLEYVLSQSRQTEYDTISFGLQTLSMSAQIFRLESDVASYSLEYEIVSCCVFIS